MNKLFNRPTADVGRNRTSLSTYLIIGSLVIFVMGAVAGWGFMKMEKKETVFVNTKVLFDAFEMTKGYRAKLENAEQARKATLDKLELQAQSLATRLEAGSQDVSVQDSLQQLISTIEIKRKSFTADNEFEAEQYNEQIWTQLNQYVQDYCEQNSLAYVMGATGQGALMAADPSLDHTDEILQFANNRFAGSL